MPAKTMTKTLTSLAPAFALPVLFLGYAVVANYEFISGLGRDLAKMPQSATAYLSGEAAVEIDAYYKKIMPHRLPSIDLMGAARYLVFKEGRKGVLVGKDGWLFSREEFEATLTGPANLAKAREGLLSVRDALAESGVKLVLLPLPAKVDIYREHNESGAIPDDLAKLYADFVSLARSLGIDTIDARSALVTGKDEAPLFLTTDTHWTPSGAARVAEATGAALGKGTQTFTLTLDAPQLRDGDLSKFIVTGGLAPLVGLGPETVVPYVAAAASPVPDNDIFGSGSFPYALVGTSYSANGLWSFAESLKSALGADVLNLAEEGRGPVAPMQAFLASDTLRDSPPETVLWEFPVRYLGDAKLWSAEVKSP
jgi:alginate O-acetyltransferase complex protein AlgJ